MNSVLSKVIAVLLSLFLIAYVVYQSFVALYNPYQTEIVKLGSYVQNVDLNGFFVRDESLIDVTKDGVISYHYKNAQKISKDATVASVYSNENDLYNLDTIQMLKKNKAILTEAQSKDSIEGLKLDLLNSQISASKANLVKQVDEGSLSNIESTFDTLMLNLNKLAVCVDNTINYEETIASLDSRIADLETRIPVQNGVVSSGNSGYFSNTVDGYESEFTPAMLSTLTIAQAESLLAAPKTRALNNIGKIVNENYWYFVSVVSAKDAETLYKPFHANKEIKLKFNSKSTRVIGAGIERIIAEKDNDTAVVVFKSFFLDDDLINMRFETPQAIIGNHSGIVIPKEAIRLQNGVKDIETGEVSDKVKGVYTLLGKAVRFRKVDILYEDDYVVVSKQTTDANYVSVYDQVIIKGKDLNAPS